MAKTSSPLSQDPASALQVNRDGKADILDRQLQSVLRIAWPQEFLHVSERRINTQTVLLGGEPARRPVMNLICNGIVSVESRAQLLDACGRGECPRLQPPTSARQTGAG